MDILRTTAEVLSAYPGARIAVGVSGGRDSVCLLHAAVNCGAVKKSDILAVHVNHCLRDAADSDEAFVRELCKNMGVRFFAARVDVNGEVARTGKSVEQAARELRYNVFRSLISSGEADIILTAHHALDNAETVLMHMFRGAGLDGMCGMSAAENKTVRPLLGVYPAELDEYCRVHGLKYVTDETNLCDNADRNFLRLNVIPLIEERYPGAVRAINGLSRECGAVCDALDATLDLSLISSDRGAVNISDKALRGPLATRYVRRALGHFTLTDITREQTERVAGLVGMRTGAVVQLPGGMEAARGYGQVSIYIPRPPCTEEKQIALGANFIDGLPVDIAEDFVDPFFFAGGAVDLDKLAGATLRFRRDGDMFTPFGGRRKKLKQYFIDIKMEKRLRDRTPLICRGSDVLVVCGVQISDEVKITTGTKRPGTVTVRW